VIRLLADENFNNNIVRGVRLRNSDIDLVRIQDVGLSGTDDPGVLEWAAKYQRILLTHYVATITAFAYERVRAGNPMPGVFEVSLTVALRSAIEDIVLLATCSEDSEWEGQVRYLPQGDAALERRGLRSALERRNDQPLRFDASRGGKIGQDHAAWLTDLAARAGGRCLSGYEAGETGQVFIGGGGIGFGGSRLPTVRK